MSSSNDNHDPNRPPKPTRAAPTPPTQQERPPKPTREAPKPPTQQASDRKETGLNRLNEKIRLFLEKHTQSMVRKALSPILREQMPQEKPKTDSQARSYNPFKKRR